MTKPIHIDVNLTSDNRESLIDIVQDIRLFLEPRWMEWRAQKGVKERKGTAKSHNMCRFSCLFLIGILKEEFGDDWVVKGGDGDHPEDAFFFHDTCDISKSPGGFLDNNGEWQAHYWIENTKENYIIDITADQFGDFPPITITDSENLRYRDNFWPKAVKSHLKDASVSVQEWLLRWSEERINTSSPRI